MPTSSNRLYAGKMPGDGLHIANLVLGDETWHLCARNVKKTDAWPELKLFSKVPVPTKANYWFSWSMAEARFARHPDVALMREHRPELHALLDTALRAIGREYGDPRRIPEDDIPFIFRATPSAPIGVQGAQGATPGEPDPGRPLGPLLVQGAGAKGQREPTDAIQSGDPDGDLL